MPMNFQRAKETMEGQERWERAPLDRTEPRLEAELREADNVTLTLPTLPWPWDLLDKRCTDSAGM